MIKWIGYPNSENTWEPLSLLDDWDVEREQIYKFFEDENIDISGCAKFDFVKREFKNNLKKSVGDDLSDYERLRAEKTRRNKAYLAKLGLDNPKKNYICDATHDVENLKQETDGKYAKEPYFLYKKNCQICKVVFVYKEEEAMEKEKQFRVSTTNPCYICQSNPFCTYYMCGRCYNTKIVSGGKPKRVRV